MAVPFPRPNHLFLGVGAALLVVLPPIACLTASEPREGSPKTKPERALAAAEEGTEPTSALDRRDGSESGQLEFRTWTDASRKYRSEAAFLGFANGQVRLEKRDGARITVAIEKLDKADQEFVKVQMAVRAPEQTSQSEDTQTDEEPEAASDLPTIVMRIVFLGVFGLVIANLIFYVKRVLRDMEEEKRLLAERMERQRKKKEKAQALAASLKSEEIDTAGYHCGFCGGTRISTVGGGQLMCMGCGKVCERLYSGTSLRYSDTLSRCPRCGKMTFKESIDTFDRADSDRRCTNCGYSG